MIQMASEMKFALPDEVQAEISLMFIKSAQQAFQALIQQQSYPQYLNQKQAADYLSISVTSFKKLNIPRVSLENIERYDKATLDQYCKAHEF